MQKNLAVTLDLEMNQPSGKIIQIGAVIGDLASGSILTQFTQAVNPNEMLTPFIIELTGIAQDTVDTAPDLAQAYALLCQWMAPYARQRILNPIIWGGDDTVELRKQMEQYGLTSRDPSLATEDAIETHPEANPTNSLPAWPFGRRWLDAKTVFAAWCLAQGKNPRSGLGRSVQRMGIEFEGHAHDAGVDAANTFKIWVALMRSFRTVE